jgi:elongation factor G
MHADIGVGEPYLGAIMADFTRRRGEIRDLQVRGNLRHLLGDVPLSEVRGYVTALRDMTSGRGDFSLEFRQYDLVPDDLAEAVIEERQARGKVSRR